MVRTRRGATIAVSSAPCAGAASSGSIRSSDLAGSAPASSSMPGASAGSCGAVRAATSTGSSAELISCSCSGAAPGAPPATR